MIHEQNLKHLYSDGITNKKILVIGNYPPPLGGVSVHIARVIKKLEQQKNHVLHFDPIKRGNKCVYAVRLLSTIIHSKPDIIYYHTVDLNATLIEFKLLALVKKIMRYTLTIVEHNCRHLYARSTAYKKKFSKLMQHVDHLVLIGHTTYQSYQQNLDYLPLHTIEAAFLPPDSATAANIVATYPASIHIFLHQHTPIISFNAYQLVMLNNKDLYGLDLCIEALQKLKKYFPHVGLICALSHIGNHEYFALLQQKIKDYELHNNIYFLMSQKEFWPLLEKTDLFVRPTRSDAESVSVQEALFFGIPVIASDASTRPPSVITFASGNALDLYNKMITALHKENHEVHNMQRDHLHPQ